MWEKRNFHGYLQTREVTTGRVSKWAFQVLGFGDVDCRVLMSDGSHAHVPIDRGNKITIRGRKYAWPQWNH
jgi:hypothetical protein